MAEIPRIPNVAPSQAIAPQNYRVQHAADRQPHRQRHDEPHPDVVELHDEEIELAPAEDATAPGENEGHVDLVL